MYYAFIPPPPNTEMVSGLYYGFIPPPPPYPPPVTRPPTVELALCSASYIQISPTTNIASDAGNSESLEEAAAESRNLKKGVNDDQNCDSDIYDPGNFYIYQPGAIFKPRDFFAEVRAGQDANASSSLDHDGTHCKRQFSSSSVAFRRNNSSLSDRRKKILRMVQAVDDDCAIREAMDMYPASVHRAEIYIIKPKNNKRRSRHERFRRQRNLGRRMRRHREEPRRKYASCETTTADDHQHQIPDVTSGLSRITNSATESCNVLIVGENSQHQILSVLPSYNSHTELCAPPIDGNFFYCEGRHGTDFNDDIIDLDSDEDNNSSPLLASVAPQRENVSSTNISTANGSNSSTDLKVGNGTLSSANSVLRLDLKTQAFEVMVTGEKNEEFRKNSPWIRSRLLDTKTGRDKKYDFVEFTTGSYSLKGRRPRFTCRFKGFYRTTDRISRAYSNGMTLLLNALEPNSDDDALGIYVIKLGEIVHRENCIGPDINSPERHPKRIKLSAPQSTMFNLQSRQKNASSAPVLPESSLPPNLLAPKANAMQKTSLPCPTHSKLISYPETVPGKILRDTSIRK